MSLKASAIAGVHLKLLAFKHSAIEAMIVLKTLMNL
jgi:hypothetical protein